MTTWRRLISRRTTAAALASSCVCGLVLALAPIPRAGGAAGPPTVGVVDFYAQTPLPPIPGVVLEPFSADDLSGLLAGSASGRLTVIASAVVRRAEGDLHWQSADVLRFDRLRALADALGADRLVVGWIPQFSVDPGGDPVTDGGRGPIMADANIVVQVFDASAGRLIGETRQSGSVLGSTTSLVATRALHVALQRSLPELLRLLGAPSS